MTQTLQSNKTRTVALPNLSKDFIQARQIQAKLKGRVSALDSNWAPTVFGPYLVPLTRHVE
jgi:hypothetical protein